ncbi:MAG: hypothetical protein AAGH15_18520 [Myxococcota bacterium]
MSREREALQARQDAMVRALLESGPPPAGVDARALDRARRTLAAKRRWVAARRPASRRGWGQRLLRRLRAFAD